MILTKLIIVDFGLYGGRHEFDLRPQEGPDGPHPLVLFGGKNGAGKSTILEAVQLCLYGRESLGYRVRPADYQAYLEKRLHRSHHRSAEQAAVALEFEYAELGERTLFYMERAWQRTEDGVIEHLALRRNGELQFGLGPDYWQDFLNDLIPLGLADLFFFDGERIQSLADDERGNAMLGQALKDLLGVNLVEQLETDLGVYLTRLDKSDKAATILKQLEPLEQERERLLEQVSVHRQDIAGCQSKLDHIHGKIQEKETQISSRGGLFAEHYAANQGRKQALQAAIAQQQHSLEEACADLLPFALAPTLLRHLGDQLQAEERIEYLEATHNVLEAQAAVVASELITDDFWQELTEHVPQDLREVIAARVQQSLMTQAAQASHESTMPMIHALSSRDRSRLAHWIEEVIGPTLERSRAYVQSLVTAEAELEQVERMLQAVPPEELLAPLIRELHNLHRDEATVTTKRDAAREAQRQAEYALTEVTRTISKLETQLQQTARREGKGELAGKARRVLAEFRQELLRLKIADLEAAFTEYFNRLARKQGFISHVLINERDFTMTLVSREGRYIPKAQLSAGEKQIYAIALLWALRAVAARPLPIIIDTPLGRLDSNHRQNLVEHYFPNASHQVIVLSTDTEIDETYFRELEPFISHAYHLVYDEGSESTHAEEGYFWHTPSAVEELSHAT